MDFRTRMGVNVALVAAAIALGCGFCLFEIASSGHG
jgi:hypothetical protein